jgi:hypothetical protein
MLVAKAKHDLSDLSELSDLNDLNDLSLRESEPQRKGYVSFRGQAKRSYSVPNPGGFLDWLLFKNSIRKPIRLRAKGKNQVGEEGNTIDLRWFLRLLRHPGTLS